MKSGKSERRRPGGAGLVAAATFLVLAGPSAAGARITLTVGSGSAPQGGTVAIPVTLGSEGEEVVGADLVIQFADSVLDIDPSDCVVAGRISSATHRPFARFLPPLGAERRLLLQVVPSTDGDPPPPPTAIGDGQLFSCTFGVRSGAPLGDATLRAVLTNASRADGIPFEDVLGVDGVVTVQAPVPTPTLTSTPPPTETSTVPPTDTPVPTATPTNTLVPTATSTRPPPTSTAVVPTDTPVRPTATPTRRKKGGGGCSITAPGRAEPVGALVLLLGPGLLLWGRRRRY